MTGYALDTEGMARSRRTILRGADAEAGFTAQLDLSGMEVLAEVCAPESEGLVRQIRWSAGAGLQVFFGTDAYAGCSYFFVEGRDLTAVLETHVQLALLSESWLPDQLLGAIDGATSTDMLIEALIRAGLGAPPEFDEDFFAHLTAYFHHPEVDVRAAAVLAVCYAPWREYLPLLRELAERDPDKEVRLDAGLMAEGITKRAKGADS